MAVTEVDIYQIGNVPDKCFKWDGAAFADQSALAFTVGGTPQTLWEDSADVMYIGKSTVSRTDITRGWCYLGYKASTGAVGYGTFSFEYSADYTIAVVNQGTKTFTVAENLSAAISDGTTFWIEGSTGNDGMYTAASATYTGAVTNIVVDEAIPDATADGVISWISLSTLHDGTSGFTQDGFVMWVLPGAWTLRDVDSTTRYWIRAYQDEAAPATPATYECLLENITLYPPVKLLPSPPEKIVHDINNDTRKCDLANYSPPQLTITAGVLSLKTSLANLNLLFDWDHYGLKLDVYDMAHSSNPTPSTDSYYKRYRGRITSISPGIKAVWKQDIDDTWKIEMKIEETDSITTLAGG